MRIGIYPGSFDPFTLGHLHVLKQALGLFDEIILCIAPNSSKNVRRINEDLMIEAIVKTLKAENIENVRIVRLEGLLAHLARKEGAQYLIKGLRNSTDFQYEENMAKINEEVDKNLNTIYFRAGKTEHISSSAVMELYKYGEDISAWVPSDILNLIKHTC